MPSVVMSINELRKALAAKTGPLAPVPADFRIGPALGRELVQIVVSDVKSRFLTSSAPDGRQWKPLKYARPRGPGRPLLDTGLLMASITGTHTDTSVTVGTNRPGAALHQFGGTVTPKRGKYLTIPLTPMAAAARSPRMLVGTKALPVFARMVGGRWVGHFLCVKKVEVPARPFLGLSRRGTEAVVAAVQDELARRWEKT